MYMAFSLHSSTVRISPFLKYNNARGQLSRSVLRAQRFSGDEGSRWSEMVDEASLSVLKERIEEVKMKERLERCCRCENGWNYNYRISSSSSSSSSSSGHGRHGYNSSKQNYKIITFFHLLGLVGSTIGLTCFSATAFLYLFSILFHLSQY